MYRHHTIYHILIWACVYFVDEENTYCFMLQKTSCIIIFFARNTTMKCVVFVLF